MVLRTGVRTVLIVCLFASVLPAQQDRITAAIDSRRPVVRRGSVPVQVRNGSDQGSVESDFRLGNITLMLGRTPAQQAALEKLLAEQQDPSSPRYHQWLTPETYAEQFGASAADLEKIAAWLKSEGFGVKYTARGRDFISFSGTAAQVGSALHTEIHRFAIGGKTHFANATDFSLPEAIAPMVTSVMGLHDFHPRAPRKQLKPAFTDTDGSHFLLPDDFATIYNMLPLYLYGYTGLGQNIAIVGQSDINLSDIDEFRATWDLPGLPVQMVSVGNYPGITDDSVEADLDLEWAGAVARFANLIYVYSDVAGYSSFFAIDNNLAPVLSESFGLCESQATGFGISLKDNQTEAQKANSLGITWLASSGDSGAAGCDYDAPIATQGLAVGIPASVPEVTAVGGTEFNEGSVGYWTAANGPYGGSALSYIPEMAWNDTAASGSLASSSGGVSSFYLKPSWQTGPGVPSGGYRDVPDISMNASNAHDAYVVVTQGEAFGVGGTSASSPAFAGVLAVLNQFLVQNKVQSKAGLGNINPKLYTMAGSNPGAFHDVTAGNNMVPCQSGTPDCVNGTFGYSAGKGYDLVTGLGSVDGYNFILAWAGLPVVGTTLSLSASPATIQANGSSTLTATVKAASGSTSPTGPVQFTMAGTLLGAANLAGSGGSATASIPVFGGQLLTANNTVTAIYSGGPTFTQSSASTTLNLGTPTKSAVKVTVTPNPVYQTAPAANGATFSFSITLQETAGVATTITGFTFGGVSYGASIAKFFGGTTLPAHGTLTAKLASSNIVPPETVTIEFTGSDASGATWSKGTNISFLPKQ